MLRWLRRWLEESDGMEMLEWAIVGLLFAIATAGVFTTASDSLRARIGELVGYVAGLGG
jgi:hypothetical protein